MKEVTSEWFPRRVQGMPDTQRNWKGPVGLKQESTGEREVRQDNGLGMRVV